MSKTKSDDSASGGGALTRRRFIAKTAMAAAGAAALPLLSRRVWAAGGGAGEVAIVLDAKDALAKDASARWATKQLRDALIVRGLPTRIVDAPEQVPVGQECIVATGRTSALAAELAGTGGMAVPDAPEALGLAWGTIGKRKALLACGADSRGLVYALLELADRVNLGGEPLTTLRGVEPTVERPANRIRSVMRIFASELEDKPWYNDRAFWRDYLTMLAAQRFNRFNLALGLAYDGPAGLRDAYFYFAYPFLVKVPGYDVRAARLPEGEPAANLEMLRFISDEAARRGLHFQLGVWTHAYKWTDGPNVNYMIEGLTDDTQAAYSRDALRAILEACPGIKGLTIRIHGESGVPEGSYDFWKTVFDGIVKTGRPVELDLHAKGMDQATIDVALATGLPVKVSPKFWAEHLGLPYMQAAIRNLEMPPSTPVTGFYSLSTGSRRFLRYGYGDLLTQNRPYQVIHRSWPGTQRVLLWGDPVMAAALGRNWSFCGSDGMEFIEPLSFKGRKGSGLRGLRDGYADAAFSTGGSGWQKYLYTYRLWGRLSYNPDAKPESWRRLLKSQLGAVAEPSEAALGSASRLLPLITVAHLPSAANNLYWPEMYLNMPIVKEARSGLYPDSPSPRRFGTVSPLDPQMFAAVDEFADELVSQRRSGKYSPGEVAQWLENLAHDSQLHLAKAEKAARKESTPAFQRLAVDVALQNGVGLFFAGKFRAAALYALYLRSGDRRALAFALATYAMARGAWADGVNRANGVYVTDITYGLADELRGNWSDRLAAMDEDIGEMKKAWDEPPRKLMVDPRVTEWVMAEVLSPAKRPDGKVEHAPVATFKRGTAVTLGLKTKGHVTSVRLYYRRVNQAETWRSADLTGGAGKWAGAISADYTDSAFPLQYYFELRKGPRTAWLHPGLGVNLMQQPYYVVSQT